MSSSQFYRDQSAEQMTAARGASLDNVRERCERAARAWDALAARSEKSDAARAQAAADKRLQPPSENPDRGHAASADGAA